MLAFLPLFTFTRNKDPSPVSATAELSHDNFVSITARETASEIDRARDASRLSEMKLFLFHYFQIISLRTQQSQLFLNDKFTLGVMKVIICV